MFRKRYHKRSSFLPFVIFRSLLSLIIFGIFLIGIYGAFKQFSGIDIVKINLLQRDILGLVTNFIPASVSLPQSTTSVEEQKEVSKPKVQTDLEFKFMLVTDSHNDNTNLKKALTQVPVDFVIGLGDYTEVGSISELEDVKKVFDSVGLRNYLTAGDHDLWDARNNNKPSGINFTQVLNSSHQSFSYKNTRFLMLDNSDNYTGFGEMQLKWLMEEISRIQVENSSQLILAFLHEPLYHPSSTRIMGKVTPSLVDEAKKVTKLLKGAGVAEVFSGDIHYFTRYIEPETNMPMTTVGAITADRNAQSPRFAVVSVFDNGTYEVEDVEVRTP